MFPVELEIFIADLKTYNWGRETLICISISVCDFCDRFPGCFFRVTFFSMMEHFEKIVNRG